MAIKACGLAIIGLFLVGCVGQDLPPTPADDTTKEKESPASTPAEKPEESPNDEPTGGASGAAGSNGTAAPVPGDLWKGTWYSSFGGASMNGAMTLSMTEGASSTVSGTATFGSSPCVPSATIEATRTGTKIMGKLIAAGVALDFTTTLSADGKSLTGSFSGQAGGCGTMSGTYDAKLGG